MLIKLFGIIPWVGEALKQDIFHGGYSYVGVPFFIHFIVSIVTAVLSFVIPDYDPQLLSNIFNVLSTLVCICVCIFAGFTTEQLNGMTEDAQKAAGAGENKVETTGEKSGENQVEAAAAAGPAAGPASTGLKDASGINDTKEEVEAFGKRQRRRNPPKRRKKKY